MDFAIGVWVLQVFKGLELHGYKMYANEGGSSPARDGVQHRWEIGNGDKCVPTLKVKDEVILMFRFLKFLIIILNNYLFNIFRVISFNVQG